MLRLVAHARKFAVGSALAIASLGMAIPTPAAAAQAGHWDVIVGGGDFVSLGLDRFYPNNITVHPGDTVSFQWGGFHTVTFNPSPSFTIFDSFGGPAGSSTLSSSTTFINATPGFGGPGTGPPPNFDLAIASALPNGKYKYQCAIHQFMHGEINVTRGALPSSNGDNQTLAATQMAADTAQAIALDNATTRDAAEKSGEAVVGVANRVAEYVKFYPSAITVRAGQQLHFASVDLHEPHTVTFGPVAGDPRNPATGVFPSGPGNPNAFDGTSALNSGFLFDESQYDYWNIKSSPVAAAKPVTEWNVTFTTPGTYNFYCDLHGFYDPTTGAVGGMSGSITVLSAGSGG